ncbi:GMC family oxidoreductase [Pseudomaricurvus alkylphenolicus]|uniref:GMC oxidoreductase n=1 Tax=Pseudomaricurvus alkylphenolicus TaxID=1306991 RepID=UPI0014206D93|nr:GMC oxidoreductase [Pseudomaricurvus alkylphenolicus]NIB43536.1 GMC family oxidoreductase [Pseudomaricurvus alkylphenolicus]
MIKEATLEDTYDFVIVGSGFGGSVSALRLAEKGYRVLVIEKGTWYNEVSLPGTTWKLGKWLWMPSVGLRGIMKMTHLRHATVMSGVGVGGGSLVYGATLPTPKSAFFNSGSWSDLADWEKTLKPHYATALKMLGARQNPTHSPADEVIKTLAENAGKPDKFEPSKVGIFFSDADREGELVDDPYFDGQGPKRRGCIQCGECMTGCRHNAKNSLDKNYLYLAQKMGVKVLAETEVVDISPSGSTVGDEGYFVTARTRQSAFRSVKRTLSVGAVIFSGGVVGTVPLLLKLKQRGRLPRLSARLGQDIRTNNESLTGVTSLKDDKDFSRGIAIGSILSTDEHSHVEPVHYGAASGTWRFLLGPLVTGGSLAKRFRNFLQEMVQSPAENLNVLFRRGWGHRTIYLLFMQHLDSTLSLELGRFGRIKSKLPATEGTQAPSCDIPEAIEVTRKVEEIMEGKATRSLTDLLTGAPSTAHVLGGAVMGKDEHSGVVNQFGQVFNYDNLYICDGSTVSANPGVNPSLTITAITEHVMSHIQSKSKKDE